MTKIRFGAALVAGALSLAAYAMPASAASVATNVFLNNLVPNVNFLDQSSRFALTNSKNAKLKAYAFGQAREQTMAANAMDEWIQADKRPVDVAAADAPLQTGRSVAIDGAQLRDERLPMGQEDLDSLEGLAGTDFDTQYKAKQLNALGQIATDYETYIARGDDPQLLALANRELPKVKQRIEMLRRL